MTDYPPPAAPPLGTYGPPSQGMAKWALGLSFLVCVPVALLVSAGLAISVLVQSRDGRDHGKGYAVAALVIDACWVLLIVLVGVIEAVSPSSDEPTTAPSSSVAVADLGEGQCFDLPADAGSATGWDRSVHVGRVELVPCRDFHDLEVYHREQVPGSEWPGTKYVVDHVRAFCTEEFQYFVGTRYQRSELLLVYFHPEPRSWALGDHDGSCAVGDITGRQTRGTLHLSRR